MGAKVVQLDAKTWRIEEGFVYYYLLTGRDSALLIDSGVTGDGVLACVKELTDLPITLVNTHSDGDHIAGNGDFAEFYMHPADYNDKVAGRFTASTCKPVSEGYEFDLGGRILRVIDNPGHTHGSIALLDIEERVIYAGDSVQNSIIYLFGDHRCPEKFGPSLEKLIAMEDLFDTVRPAHGSPDLPGNYPEKVLEEWRKVECGLLAGVEEELYGNPVMTYKGANCGFYLAR